MGEGCVPVAPEHSVASWNLIEGRSAFAAQEEKRIQLFPQRIVDFHILLLFIFQVTAKGSPRTIRETDLLIVEDRSNLLKNRCEQSLGSSRAQTVSKGSGP